MHDGASAHHAQSVRYFLHETFPERWIGRCEPIEWPARSPDLTPTDYFLWGVIKDRVHATKPKDLEELEDAIITEMGSLSEELCRKACQSISTLKTTTLQRTRRKTHRAIFVRIFLVKSLKGSFICELFFFCCSNKSSLRAQACCYFLWVIVYMYVLNQVMRLRYDLYAVSIAYTA